MIPTAVGPELTERLGADDRRQWRLLGDEGMVRQHAYGSYLHIADALPAVRAVGDQVVGGLSAAARRRGLPAVPAFNEVTWSRYPPQAGRITAHRDPTEYAGIIAVFTLRGQAVFRTIDQDRKPTEWDTTPGQLVVLRGSGWPRNDSRCPVHEVEAPQTGERMIMTLRYNSGGAGTGYLL